MVKRIAVVLFALFAVVAAHARADDPSPQGLTAGLRFGYGLPIGSARANLSLGDAVSGAIPLWLELGYRIDHHWLVGGFFQYGLGFAGDVCSSGSGLDCSAKTIRIGAEGVYRVRRSGEIEPWIGAGIGYEMTSIHASANGREETSDVSGFEFGNLQVGGDFRVSPRFAVGPYLAMSLARYSSATSDVPGQTTTKDIPSSDQTFHAWFQFGVKGTFDM
jgi:hypothetical protein